MGRSRQRNPSCVAVLSYLVETICCRRVYYDYIKQLIISAIMLVEDFYRSVIEPASQRTGGVFFNKTGFLLEKMIIQDLPILPFHDCMHQ